MNTIVLFTIIICILLGYITSTKQYKASKNITHSQAPEIAAMIAFILAPIWIIVAIIRQVFIEDWK
jgi:ABC-type dipeptide/oligopeptide/nickel transport system permease component